MSQIDLDKLLTNREDLSFHANAYTTALVDIATSLRGIDESLKALTLRTDTIKDLMKSCEDYD